MVFYSRGAGGLIPPTCPVITTEKRLEWLRAATFPQLGWDIHTILPFLPRSTVKTEHSHIQTCIISKIVVLPDQAEAITELSKAVAITTSPVRTCFGDCLTILRVWVKRTHPHPHHIHILNPPPPPPTHTNPNPPSWYLFYFHNKDGWFHRLMRRMLENLHFDPNHRAECFMNIGALFLKSTQKRSI